MSDRTREILGDAENVGAALVVEPSFTYASLRFTRMWAASDRLFLLGEVSQATPDIAGTALLRVQSSLVRHYFQLQHAERHLSTRARKSSGGGSAAIRQVELERQRLGRDLHTGVGQLLAAIRMQLEVIAAQLPEPPLVVQQALDRISALASDALEQVRAISKRLHPPEWQRLTLAEALRQLWENSGIPQRYDGALDVRPLPRDPELEVKVLFYRAVQEALSNLARHAQATRINITLEPGDGELVLTVRDNGVGFDAAALFAAPASITSGIGLRSIRDQAAAIGGNVSIESGPAGTKLEVTAPYSPVDLPSAGAPARTE